MRNKILLSLAIIFIATTIFTACEKETEIIEQKQSEQAENNLSDIDYSHGMLVFKSKEQYDSITANESGITKEEIINWQLKIGFVSQQSILEQALIEEEKFYEQFDPATMSEKEIDQVVKQKEAMGYTEFTKKYIAEGIIKPYKNRDISSLELTTVSAVLPIFLNLDGMIKIGNIIYQYTPTQCKQITDGDFSKIQLLKESTKNSENIIIGNLVTDKGDYHDYLAVLANEISGHYKIEAGILLRIWDYGTFRQFYYYLQYRNWKEKWFFGWNWKQDSEADTDINGSLKITVQGESSQYHNLYYSKDNQWSDHVSVAGFFNVNSPKTVTFSNAGFTFKRNNVSSSVYRTHATTTK